MLLADRLKAAKATFGDRPPPEFIGGVGDGYARGYNFTSDRALNIFQYATVGDLVVVSFTARAGSSSGFSWGGMPFTPIVDGSANNDPAYYVGYRFVQSGDANPYFSSSDLIALSVTGTVFRGASSFVGTTAYASGAPPTVPQLTANASLWLVSSGRWAETTLPETPSGYSVGASNSFDGQSANDATSLQSYKAESLSSETPSYTGNLQSWAVLSAFI